MSNQSVTNQPVTNEPMCRAPTDQALAAPPGAAEPDEWTLLQELRDENRRLREIVIYLSGVIVRGVVDRK